MGVSSISGVGDVAVVDEVSLAEAPACGEQTVMVVVVVVVVVVASRRPEESLVNSMAVGLWSR